ncbi:carbohydrate ABC transporter permease [Portibacter marinus]|uniref:carbohydrate ABC transporter permease n=1 Tax=Portibacter marinus TaxID=2898660 RepID=UPI001F1AA9A7|nr:sugar ABC transporter permease [Portibacter marinus]
MKAFWNKISPYLIISPYIIHLGLFVLFPVIFSIVLVLHKWNIISPMEYVGLDNFQRLFSDRLFWKALWNTFIFILVHIPLQIVIALFLAYFLNEKILARSFFRAAFFMPVVISGVVITILWQQLYGLESGVINRMLISLGLNRVEWLSNPNIAMISIAIMATWKNVGLYVILFLVGLQTVPRSYYEAAEVEGASAWQQFRYITIPAINPTIFMVVILSTIGGFSLFIEPYIMTDGGPLNSTLSAMLYIYKQAFGYYHMGYSATLSIFFAIIIMGVVVVQKIFVENEEH